MTIVIIINYARGTAFTEVLGIIATESNLFAAGRGASAYRDLPSLFIIKILCSIKEWA